MSEAGGQKERQLGRGMRVAAIGQTIAQAIQFPTNVALARMLSPQEFGLVGQVAVFTGLAYFVSDFGLGTAIVQRKELDEEQLSSVFWVNFAVGIAVFLVFCAAAPGIAAFYRNQELVPLTIAVAVTFVFSSLKVTHYNLLSREMSFGKLAWVDASAQLGGSISSIALAALGYGVWSLVALRVVRAAVPVLVLFLLSDFRPRFVLSITRIRDMLRFGSFLLGSTTARYFSRNVDKLLVGRAFGEVPLGHYLRAFDFMLLPVEQISQVVGRVILPALSRSQDAHHDLQRLLLSGLQRSLFFVAPVMGLSAVAAEPLTVTLFGPQWRPAAGILQVFCALGVLNACLLGVRWIHVAKGATSRLFLLEILSFVMITCGCSLGARYGLREVAAGMTAAQLLYAIPAYRSALKLIELSPVRLLSHLLPTLCCAGLSTAISWTLSGHLKSLPEWLQWLVLSVAMVLVYLPLAALFRLPMLSFLTARFFSRSAPPPRS